MCLKRAVGGGFVGFSAASVSKKTETCVLLVAAVEGAPHRRVVSEGAAAAEMSMVHTGFGEELAQSEDLSRA